jgi:hypothetical protein
LVARERGEEGEWDEWEGGGRTFRTPCSLPLKKGPTFPLLPHSSHSPSSPRSRATNVLCHAGVAR